MTRFKLFRLAIEYGPKIAKLLDFPGVDDSEKLRAYVSGALDILDSLSDLTETETDDAIVEVLAKVVDNDTAWNGLHGILVALIDLDGDDELNVGSDMPVVHAIAKEVGMDPVTIISMILMALKGLRIFRDWRQNR